MRADLKRILHLFGSAVAVIGVVFVVLRLQEYGSQVDFGCLNVEAWIFVAGLALIYGLASIMLAFAWWNLLNQFYVKKTRWWAFKAHGVSQLAKYVPGNIFHLAGRQAIGMAAGVAAWPLAKSTVWELGLLAVTGGLFGLLALPLLVATLPLPIGIGGFLLVVVIMATFLWCCIGPPVAKAFGWYVLFLTVSGSLFAGLVNLVTEVPTVSVLLWSSLCGSYVLAWLAGLVTPGAPAGVGVRELVLLFLLKGVVAEADLVVAVVLGRVVTVVGDMLYFTIASLSDKFKPSQGYELNG